MYKRKENKEEIYSIAILIKIIDEAIEKRANRILRQYNLTFSRPEFWCVSALKKRRDIH